MIEKKQQLFNFLLTILLAFILLIVSTGSTLAKKEDPPKADPRLIQMAQENPEAIFMVIVQKDARNNDLRDVELEDEVLKGGGQIKKHLDLIVSFSAEMTGKEITRLAKNPKVRWISADAPMVATGSPGMESIRDEFINPVYEGNNGTFTWTTGWAEGGESTSPTSGLIQVVKNSACDGGSGYCLRLDPANPTGTNVSRQANLSGIVSVWLSFYRNNQLSVNSTGVPNQVQLQVSSDGGASWTTLQSYSGSSNIGPATEMFDISAYASVNTQIRFLIPKSQTCLRCTQRANQIGARYIYFDNLEITFARPSAFLATVKADQLTLDGQGVTVAVIDSGLTTRNNDFKSDGQSRVIAEAAFGNQESTQDLYGHGTHVAGILGGNGAASGGLYRGVAPGIELINLRVSDKDGLTYESNVLAGLQWVYDNKDIYNIRVVNLSMNSTIAQSYHTSPLDAAVEILWFNGIVVVVSAGNNGTGEGPATIYPPANDPFVITVGATNDKGTAELWDDNLAVFSAYGHSEDGYSKPDLVAPGRNLVAPLSEKASTVYTAHPMHRVGDEYFRMSGTSMSAPVVSGAVALLLQSEPYLTPDQVKYRLVATASIPAWCAYIQVDYQPVSPVQLDELSLSPDGVTMVDGTMVSAGCEAGYLDIYSAVYGGTSESANQGIIPSQMLATGENPIGFGSVGWNSVGWNSVGWNSVGWNSVGWNSVGWNSVGWNTSLWDVQE
jgi:serine protease AprX